MTAQKYPNCISCGEEMSPQDSRGWLPLKPESDMFLCPNCIYESDACKDAVNNAREELMPHIEAIGKFQRGLANFLDLLESCRDKDGM